MTDKEIRIAFEHWASDHSKWNRAIERDMRTGDYKLMQTQMYWNAWRAAAKAFNAMHAVTP